MKKFAVIIVGLLVSVTMLKGQSSSIKQINKADYLKAEKKIQKELAKSPDDIEANYAMSILYIQRNYDGYNPLKAYETLNRTGQLYKTINDEKELNNLEKIPINTTQFNNLNDTICRCALEDAIAINSITGFDDYLRTYLTISQEYKNKAILKRDSIAFSVACQSNKIEAYQYFITTYPNALNRTDAENKRNALAFASAQTLDKVSSYQNFIKDYPQALEIPLAKARMHEIAFNLAVQSNNSFAYKQFIDTYPDSKQFSEAHKRYEWLQFQENTIPFNWQSYSAFYENTSGSSYATAALDSIYTIGIATANRHALRYCTDNYTGSKRNMALLKFHDIFTADGESITLDQFYKDYNDDILADIKIRDYDLARRGDALNLNDAYKSSLFNQYDEYIRLSAPRERAFIALQRIISIDIAKKDWISAIKKASAYKDNFTSQNPKYTNLLSLLEAKWDASIRINSVGSGVNTTSGGEYVPVISADDKLLYFCGKNRKDNIGGEDILVSKKSSNGWGIAKLVPILSSEQSNDAPVCISADGTTMVVFKSGKLCYTQKDGTGWTETYNFPDIINSCNWQSDAVLTSDGKALIFASTKSGGQNLYPETEYYHGDHLYPADIYVSLLDDNNNWGEPINLGTTINTPYCDRTPFLHPDMKTLYFSSDGHGGLGKMDVFKSTRLSDTCWTCWSEPVNMGKEINTEESDWGYKISTNGEKAYFARKNTPKDYDDIYWLNLPNHLRPDLVATISGKLVDKNNQPVSAEIRWEDLETGKSVGKSQSDPTDGSFFVVLPLGKIYGYYVDKGEYFPISNNIDLRKANKPIDVNEEISMVSFKQMIEEGTAVPVNNLFFNFSEKSLLPYSLPELKRVAKIISGNQLKIEISGHTDNFGDGEQNQRLSEERAQAVKAFLINEGCNESNMTTIGYGASKPIASNDSEAGRAKNRRVELRFIK